MLRERYGFGRTFWTAGGDQTQLQNATGAQPRRRNRWSCRFYPGVTSQQQRALT